MESIRVFRNAWTSTSLPWTLKYHLLSDHYGEYFHHYELISDPGAAISSDQIGEILHSRLQKMWNLRFNTRETNQAPCSQRPTYNYYRNWDYAIRESLKELVSLQNTMIDHDEAKLMKTIYTEENDRIQPHNWDTEISGEDYCTSCKIVSK